MVSAIKPVHPCDELCLQFDSDSLEHTIRFIQSDGIDLDDVLSRRALGEVDEPGVWKNGSAGFIRKLVGDENSDNEDCSGKKKYKTYRTADAICDESGDAFRPLQDQDGAEEQAETPSQQEDAPTQEVA